MSASILDDLPEIGLVASEGKTLICCAFLRQIEGNLGLFDGLCSNPAVIGTIRHLALDFVVQEIINTARDFKMRAILGWSSDVGTITRSERHYFKKLDHNQMIILDLNEKLGVH
jgi:N-acetylglutamate synthase-like GNAT family acetyltransferase